MRWGKLIALLLGVSLLLWGRAGHAASGMAATEPAHHGPPATQHILVFGDSLSAEYGLPRGTGWVGDIEQRLAERGQAYQIQNASISGDTSSGGLHRLPQALKAFHPDLVILQLGANDGLRGQHIDAMKRNLRKMIELSRDQGAEVLLVGQRIPPNYGQRYARAFHEAFGELASETDTPLVPFMLEGIATDARMFQADGLHPTVAAQKHIADVIWAHLEPMLN